MNPMLLSILFVYLSGNLLSIKGKQFSLFDKERIRSVDPLNCSEYINAIRNLGKIRSAKRYFEVALHDCIRNTIKDRDIIPIPEEDNGRAFKIRFQFAIDNLLFLKNDGSFALMATIYIYWYDERIAWNQMEIPLNYTRLSVEEIWNPIFKLANCYAEVCIAKTDPELFIYVESDGEAFSEIDRLVEANCPLNLIFFPFDRQTCNLTFLLLNAYSTEVVVESYPFGFRYFKPISDEWEIISISDYGTNFTGYSFNRTNDGKWDFKNEWVVGWAAPGFVVQVEMRRRPAYFVYNVIAPVILISLIGFMAVFLPEDSSDKLNLTITVLLAFVFIQSNVAVMVPKSVETPYIANYILYALILSSENLLASILVVGICRITPTIPPNRFLRFLTRFNAILSLKNVKLNFCCWKGKTNNPPQVSEEDIRKRLENPAKENSILDLLGLDNSHWDEVAKFVNRLFTFIYCLGSLLNFYLILLPVLMDKKR